MARSHPTVNGTHTNGENPPASTLAAQIVQNQARAPAAQEARESTTFAQLLHEILHSDAVRPETDVGVNVKLIQVVAEAGLGPLTDGNPFARWDVLIPQAIDSIAVIETTIKRQPDLLFTQVSHEGPQLLLPLLARLLAVLGREKCEELPLVRLFKTIFHELTKSLDLWQLARTLREAIEDCVDGT